MSQPTAPQQYNAKDAEAGAPLVQNQGYPQQGYPPPQQGYAPPPGYPPQQGYAPPPAGYPAAQPAPQTVIVQPVQSNHPDYLGFSIFTCLCCCWCVGIAALVKSCNVREANQRGDPNAQRMSGEALTLNKIALGLGIAVDLIVIIVIVVLFVTGVAFVRNVSQLDTYNWGFDYTTSSIYGR